VKVFAPTAAGETREEPHSNFVSEGLIPLAEKLSDRPSNRIARGSAIEMSGDAQNLAQFGAFQQFRAQYGVKAPMSGMPFAMVSFPQAVGLDVGGDCQIGQVYSFAASVPEAQQQFVILQ